MRAWASLVLLLVPLVSPATAQVVGASATLDLRTPRESLLPGQEGVAPFVLTFTCWNGVGWPEGAQVRIHVKQVAPWARAVVEPQETRVPPSACVDGKARLEGVVRLAVTAGAPAFTPEELRLAAQVTQGDVRADTLASTTFAAGFVPSLRVSLSSTSVTSDAEGAARTTVEVTNLGNAVTRVRFELAQADPGVRIQPPAPVILSPTEETRVPVFVHADPAAGPGPFRVTLRYASAYVFDNALEGSKGEVSFEVWSRAESSGGQSLNELPAPGPVGAVLALVGAAALARALSRR